MDVTEFGIETQAKMLHVIRGKLEQDLKAAKKDLRDTCHRHEVEEGNADRIVDRIVKIAKSCSDGITDSTSELRFDAATTSNRAELYRNGKVDGLVKLMHY